MIVVEHCKTNSVEVRKGNPVNKSHIYLPTDHRLTADFKRVEFISLDRINLYMVRARECC